MLAAKAAGDEAVLEKLVADPDVPDEVLGFHAQQAVEKRVKSVLADLDIRFERTHNIAYLIGLLSDHEVAGPPVAAELSTLTPWAAEFRYEDASGHQIGRERVLELVQAVRRWAKEITGEQE
jgi:HEPN domain-containing protein